MRGLIKMAKLNKQYYYSSKKNEKRINCYHVIVPKSVVKRAEIEEDDELAVYSEYDTIVIRKKYHLTCMECGYEWDSGKDADIQTQCPMCNNGDIHSKTYGGLN
jgi:rubrerythrin